MPIQFHVSVNHVILFSDNFANPELNSNSTIRSANDLTYYFYTRRHPSNSIKIKSSSVNLLALTDFVGTKDTLFIIHGWKNDNFSAVNTRIREAILSQNDLNLFVVDWGVIASQGYIGAQGSVRRVGEYVAAFVKDLKSLYRLNINKVKFVGHSLGAHIAGNAGKFTSLLSLIMITMSMNNGVILTENNGIVVFSIWFNI